MKAYGIEVGDGKDEGEASESQDAAQDILSALESKDAKALDLALKRHYACCEGDMSDDEDDEAPVSEG